VGFLIGTVVMVASLTYLPALALGPIAEQLTMATGH
jgi:K+-transporting ATPase ATPase A chain